MSSWKNDWSALSKKMIQLKEDCFHFEIEPPDFQSIQTIEKDLT